MVKLFKYFLLFKNIKFKYNKIQNTNILIFDEKGCNTIKPFLKGKNYYILKSRGEEINLYIILKMLFEFKKINYDNYLNKNIELINPKYVLHHSVNYRFFSLKLFLFKVNF